MIPLTGNVSLLAVRDDLDLTGNFSLRKDVAGKNKATWDDTTDLNLTEYRGNVLGQQYVQGGKKRNTFERANLNHSGFAGEVTIVPVDEDSTIYFPDKPKATQAIFLRCETSGDNRDYGVEARHFGKISEGGSYKLRCFVRKSNDQAGRYSKLAVVQNETGYLSGTQALVLDQRWGYGQYYEKYESTVTLDAGLPYISVIVYAIHPGTDANPTNAECKYTAIRLDKI